MRFNVKIQPLILIGMHRSGTSLVSQLLERLGVFMGYKKDENYESVFFQRINEWLLRQANASWDNPYNFKFIDRDFKDFARRIIELQLKSFRRIEYLGLEKAFQYRDIRDLDFSWGWKDPRNTFTIEIWKEIFPEVKLLHIYRNPVDVAVSLIKREEKLRREFRWNIKKRIKERLLIGKIYPHWSVRVQNIYEGINLWKEYIEKALSLDAEFGKNIFHVKYEAFLESPEVILNKICDFAGIDTNASTVSETVRRVNSNRRFAFLNDNDLVKVYNDIKDMEIMKKLGYGRIER